MERGSEIQSSVKQSSHWSMMNRYKTVKPKPMSTGALPPAHQMSVVVIIMKPRESMLVFVKPICLESAVEPIVKAMKVELSILLRVHDSRFHVRQSLVYILLHKV